MYKLIIDVKVIEFLEKLPNNISKNIFKKIQETKANPHRYFIRLTGRPEYKLRIGNYRVIAEIKDNDLSIFIIYVDKRSRVYNRI